MQSQTMWCRFVALRLLVRALAYCVVRENVAEARGSLVVREEVDYALAMGYDVIFVKFSPHLLTAAARSMIGALPHGINRPRLWTIYLLSSATSAATLGKVRDEIHDMLGAEATTLREAFAARNIDTGDYKRVAIQEKGLYNLDAPGPSVRGWVCARYARHA